MAFKTTASLDKLTCPEYVDFLKCQEIRSIFLVEKWFQLRGC